MIIERYPDVRVENAVILIYHMFWAKMLEGEASKEMGTFFLPGILKFSCPEVRSSEFLYLAMRVCGIEICCCSIRRAVGRLRVARLLGLGVIAEGLQGGHWSDLSLLIFLLLMFFFSQQP